MIWAQFDKSYCKECGQRTQIRAYLGMMT
uniref:Uncharacterized protein n=1 Tax=Vitis vinifera TaxID=29760 RepID=F6H759_VITVI